MVAKSLHTTIRLLVAGICLLLLVLWSHDLALEGGIGSETRRSLLEGLVAAVAIVFLTPVLVRGDWVQRALAFVLLILPLISLLDAFLRAAGYG